MFISGKVCLFASIKVKRQTLPEINVGLQLLDTPEYWVCWWCISTLKVAWNLIGSRRYYWPISWIWNFSEMILNCEQKVKSNQNRKTIRFKIFSGPLKVNQKWLFSGSSLETWEIKYHFWVRNWDFQPNISVFSFQLKTQV